MYADFERIIYTWKRNFKFLGINLSPKREKLSWLTLKTCSIVGNVLFIVQLFYFIASDTKRFSENSILTSYMNYSLVSLGKLLTFVCSKNDLLHCIENFRLIYPSRQYVRQYNLGNFLRQNHRVERLLVTFMHSIMVFFCVIPLLSAIVQCYKEGARFSFPLLYEIPYPFAVDYSWFVYSLVYTFQVYTSYIVAFAILCCDLCFFSFLIQLCMHFDLLAKCIAEINAVEMEAEQQLKQQIAYHYALLDLCKDVNRIFGPSITFSLMSSSFILCFSGYQLLDDVSILAIVKAIFVLLYELKQVIIACYFGEVLTGNSERLFDAIYSNNWVDGTPGYKRLVFTAMCRMRHPSALSVAKVSKLNLQSLQQILRTAYQAFTVMKAT